MVEKKMKGSTQWRIPNSTATLLMDSPWHIHIETNFILLREVEPPCVPPGKLTPLVQTNLQNTLCVRSILGGKRA